MQFIVPEFPGSIVLENVHDHLGKKGNETTLSGLLC